MSSVAIRRAPLLGILLALLCIACCSALLARAEAPLPMIQDSTEEAPVTQNYLAVAISLTAVIVALATRKEFMDAIVRLQNLAAIANLRDEINNNGADIASLNRIADDLEASIGRVKGIVPDATATTEGSTSTDSPGEIVSGKGPRAVVRVNESFGASEPGTVTQRAHVGGGVTAPAIERRFIDSMFRTAAAWVETRESVKSRDGAQRQGAKDTTRGITSPVIKAQPNGWVRIPARILSML